jgi:hypothetical protein
MDESGLVSDEGGTVALPPPSSVVGRAGLPWHTAKELAASVSAEPAWIAEPYIAGGAITDLGARVKLGKTRLTLESVAAILRGGLFLGRPTRRVPVVYLTEEAGSTFRQALARAGLLESADLHILLRHDARGTKWPDVVAAAVEKCRETSAQLLIVDTLPDWAEMRGDEENNSGRALEAMQPLRDAAASGLAVVMLRHERKAGGPVGNSTRGSSAFAGSADILLSLKPADGAAGTTRRLLEGVGRFDGIPAGLTLDLVDGHYVALGEGTDALVATTAERIHALLVSEGGVLLADPIRQKLGLKKGTAGKALKLLVADGRLEVVPGQGQTRRGKGYRAK